MPSPGPVATGLKSCSCDPKKKEPPRTTRALLTGVAAVITLTMIKFARAFVDAKERKGKDARALMNLHNNRACRKAWTSECSLGRLHGLINHFKPSLS